MAKISTTDLDPLDLFRRLTEAHGDLTEALRAVDFEADAAAFAALPAPGSEGWASAWTAAALTAGDNVGRWRDAVRASLPGAAASTRADLRELLARLDALAHGISNLLHRMDSAR